jgi:hypothetical protein
MNNDNILKVYKSCADLDFTSFYPSTCVYFNISPELITNDINKFTNKYTIDITY